MREVFAPVRHPHQPEALRPHEIKVVFAWPPFREQPAGVVVVVHLERGEVVRFRAPAGNENVIGSSRNYHPTLTEQPALFCPAATPAGDSFVSKWDRSYRRRRGAVVGQVGRPVVTMWVSQGRGAFNGRRDLPFRTRHMTRRVSSHRFALAAILVASAILPELVQVYSIHYCCDPPGENPSIEVYFLMCRWFEFDTPSGYCAKLISHAWQCYRQRWWIPSPVAAFIVVRELPQFPGHAGPGSSVGEGGFFGRRSRRLLAAGLACLGLYAERSTTCAIQALANFAPAAIESARSTRSVHSPDCGIVRLAS
jgi:hypothetical protein